MRSVFSRIIRFSQRLNLQHIHKITTPSLKQIAFGSATFTTTAFVFSTPVLLYASSSQQQEQQNKMADEIKKAEELYEGHDWKAVYEYCLQFKDSDNADLLWRLVRATRDRACMKDIIPDEKKKMIFEAFEVSKRALELGPENFACHKWYGIMMSQTGDYLGTKHKIETSPEMRKHFEKAIELNPQDATSHHLIGMWCYSFANLAWYERKIAAVVFGSPPESTYAEALGHFTKAEEVSPSAYSTTQYMIGLMYMKTGDKVKAKEWFEKLLKYDVIKDEDTENIKKAEGHLKSL